MRLDSDEKYVLDLVSNILDEKYEWQKRFDTLLGDPGKGGRRNKLPIDGYFTKLNLIVEYKEKQHFVEVSIMDRRMTVSGVNRGEQRKIYDLRKEKWAKDNNIKFLSIAYTDLKYKNNGKLLKSIEEDKNAIKKLIENVIESSR